MTENKLTEARIKANKKWDEENKERKRYINRRSYARSFIKKDANSNDLDELQNLIDERRKYLSDQEL